MREVNGTCEMLSEYKMYNISPGPGREKKKMNLGLLQRADREILQHDNNH